MMIGAIFILLKLAKTPAGEMPLTSRNVYLFLTHLMKSIR